MTTIFCVFCDTSKDVELNEIDRGQFQTCQNCGERFNLFGIYKWIYNSVSLARKLVDMLSSSIYQNFRFEGTNEKELKIIEQFRKESSFASLLSDIVFDTVLFGNSFVEKVGRDEGYFRRIDPTSIEIITSWHRRPPFKSYSEEIDRVIEYSTNTREVERPAFVHFAWNAISPPIGFSALGLWFDDWYRVAFNKGSELAVFTEYTIIYAAGVAYYLIHPEVQDKNRVIRNREARLFSTNIRRRRNNISRVVERELLPFALGRPHKHKDYPRLIFT